MEESGEGSGKILEIPRQEAKMAKRQKNFASYFLLASWCEINK
jgi:hypothetical protein